MVMVISANDLALRLSANQMDGPVDFAAYRAAVCACGDATADANAVAKMRLAMDGSRVWDGSPGMGAYLHEASTFLLEAAGIVLSSEIAGNNPATWLVYERALCCMARILCVPDTQVVQDGDAYELFRIILLSMESVGRACDPQMRASVVDDFSRGMQADATWADGVIADIWTDIVCGRVGAWIAYTNVMGAYAASLVGLSWKGVRERYAEGTMNAYIQATCDAFGWSATQALIEAVGIMHSMGDVFAMYSLARFSEASRGGLFGREAFSKLAMASGVILGKPAVQVGGYQGLFGVDQYRSVSMLPAALFEDEQVVQHEKTQEAPPNTKASRPVHDVGGNRAWNVDNSDNSGVVVNLF